jgi:hypothetical protein
MPVKKQATIDDLYHAPENKGEILVSLRAHEQRTAWDERIEAA